MDDFLENLPETGILSSAPSARRSDAFNTTHWSIVVEASTHDLARAAAALHRLCSIYWYPIYAFVRRRGANHHEAEDLTQAFFAHLLERQALQKVQQNKGKFRSFLLASLTNYLNNEWDKRHALKRGGQSQVISLDETDAEGLYHSEPAGDLSPEKLFDRRWAAMIVEKVLTQLRDEYRSANNADVLARLEPLLTQEIVPGLYAQLGAELNVNEGTVKVALHRLRRRFGELLRREVSVTVTDIAALDEEIRYLFSALSD